MAAKDTALGAAPRTATRFTPFDPAVKMAEAIVVDAGREIRVVKGAPAIVATVAPTPPAAEAALDALTRAGHRTIAVAAGPRAALELIGFIAFSDPPRADSAELLTELRSLGVLPVMITGDAAATAATIAREIGLAGPVCPAGRHSRKRRAERLRRLCRHLSRAEVSAGQAFQRQGHSVGMCGDGANDAPALRQAQMGIAVSTATDVAKAAAGVVLTEPGLGGIVACIKEGRSAFQRVLTYTLTILINKCVTLIVLGAGLIITGHAVLTPLLQALSMLTNDFVTMAGRRTERRRRPIPTPGASET